MQRCTCVRVSIILMSKLGAMPLWLVIILAQANAYCNVELEWYHNDEVYITYFFYLVLYCEFLHNLVQLFFKC